MAWKVLFLKPRTEKKVAQYCDVYDISYFLPLSEVRRKIQRRTVSVQFPLFPGYLFVNLKRPGQRLQLLETNCLAGILEPASSMSLARSLVMVRRALKAKPDLVSGPPLKKGERVEITSGPFMGIIGLVEEVRGKGSQRVVINIEMIGRSVSVQADAAELKRVKTGEKGGKESVAHAP